MKKVLVVGENSFVGNSFIHYMNKFKSKYTVDVVPSIDNGWKSINFSGYDAVYNVAGIAHVIAKPSMEALYYKVNRDLPIEIAKKAKAEGVPHFIHMSSMIVYGDMSRMGKHKNITKNTSPSPVNFYGKSKLQADIKLAELSDADFKVALIRPPLIYGENALGNFPKLIKVARTFPFFPDIENSQSMIYIDNLCELIRLIIENGESGIFHPQNKEYVCTADMVKTAARYSEKTIYTTKMFNPVIKLLSKYVRTINKAFGDLTYDKSMSDYRHWSYCVVDYEESIRRICSSYETKK